MWKQQEVFHVTVTAGCWGHEWCGLCALYSEQSEWFGTRPQWPNDDICVAYISIHPPTHELSTWNWDGLFWDFDFHNMFYTRLVGRWSSAPPQFQSQAWFLLGLSWIWLHPACFQLWPDLLCPCWLKASPRHDATTTMLYIGDDVLSVGFPPHIVICAKTKMFWPENIFPRFLRLQHVLWLAHYLSIKSSHVECPCCVLGTASPIWSMGFFSSFRLPLVLLVNSLSPVFNGANTVWFGTHPQQTDDGVLHVFNLDDDLFFQFCLICCPLWVVLIFYCLCGIFKTCCVGDELVL